MKIILSIASVTISVLGVQAFADYTTCSNADHTFFYSHVRSNGGAYTENWSMTYNGNTQRVINLNGPALQIAFSKAQGLDKQTVNGTTTAISSEFATGVLIANQQSYPFSEWVICEDVVAPVCQMCP